MTSSQRQLDGTLLSTPGTPYAFSTALKPPGSISHKSNSVLELEAHQSAGTQLDVAARLSLGSVGSDPPQLPSNTTAKALQSPNETTLSESLGILDLDAMEDSGTSQFLTSPQGAVQLRLSVATSARSSIPPTTQTPAVKPPSKEMPAVKVPSNQMQMLILPAPPIPDKEVGLDVSGSSEEELALSAGDLEQLDVTLSDQSDHSTIDSPVPQEQPQSIPSQLAVPMNGHTPNSPYNPFEDGDDSFHGAVFKSCDQDSEFKALDQASFLEQLNKDEAEVNKYNLTPSDSKLTSFTQTPQETELSMGSYFRERSDKMGQLSSRLSPHHRPQFNDSSHVVLSPPTNTTGQGVSTSSCVTDPATLRKAVSAVNPSDPVYNGQTPTVTLSPLLNDFPKLNLTNGSLSSEQGLPSLYLNKELTQDGLPSHYLHGNLSESSISDHIPSNSLTLTHDSVGGLPSHYLLAQPSPHSTIQPLTSDHSTPSTSQPLTPDHTPHTTSQQLTPSPPTTGQPLTSDHSPSTQTVSQLSTAGLPSHYLQPEDSTLVFPELSTLSSLPPDLPYPVATPPSAYLPLGFEVTNISDPPSFVTTDESHVSSRDQSAVDKTPTNVSDVCHDKTGTTNTGHVTFEKSSVIEESVSQAGSSVNGTPSDLPQSSSPHKSSHLQCPASSLVQPNPSTSSISLTSSLSTVPSPSKAPSCSVSDCNLDVTQSSEKIIPHLFSTLTASPTVSMVITPSIQAIPTPKLDSSISSALTSSHHLTTTLPPLSPLPPTPQHSLHPSKSTSRPLSSPVGGIPFDWLEVCPSLVFQSVCCVGACVSEWMDITNKGERWIQVALTLSQLNQDGLELSNESNVFVVTQRLFIGPGNKERVKVTFTPREAGVYDGKLSVCASLVVSSSEDPNPLTTVSLRATAETPRLTILTPSTHTLDYGTVVGGSTLILPVELTNSGSSSLPIRVTISCQDPLHRMYFTIVDKLCATPSSPRSHPHSLILSLPPSPHNNPHPLHISFSAPKLYHTEMTRPPLVVRGSLDIVLDSTHTPLSITSIPLEAVVGVAKLLAPGAFQGNDFAMTCLTGHTKTERVPLKNAGNIPLTVLARMSEPNLFLVSPHMLHIPPGQESYVDVTFVPTSDPVTSNVSLMLHVDPNGPDYNLSLRGVAIQPFISEFVTSRTVTLPQAMIGECSKGVLEITNPGPTPLPWTLTPAASPFLKKVSDSEDMFKVNYPVFQLPLTTSTLTPHHTDKVAVLFQPQEEGLFSQLWELKVGSGCGIEQQIQVSFGGTATPSVRTNHSYQHTNQCTVSWSNKELVTSTAAGEKKSSAWLSQFSHSSASHHAPAPHGAPASRQTLSPPHTQPSHRTQSPHHTKSSHHSQPSHRTPSPHHIHRSPFKSPPRRNVYIREEEVVFPPTQLHTRSTVKVQVCNRDVPLVKFTVVKPNPPFFVDHHTFKLGSRQCARLPIHFSPTVVGKYNGVVALRTDLKHQTFVVVRAEVSDT